MSDRTKKLVALRARTNHDLLVLVQRGLSQGFALVDVATSRNSPLFAQAEKAITTATAMLPRISDVSQGDRAQIEARLKELRSRLDQVPAYANVRPYAVAQNSADVWTGTTSKSTKSSQAAIHGFSDSRSGASMI